MTRRWRLRDPCPRRRCADGAPVGRSRCGGREPDQADDRTGCGRRLGARGSDRGSPAPREPSDSGRPSLKSFRMESSPSRHILALVAQDDGATLFDLPTMVAVRTRTEAVADRPEALASVPDALVGEFARDAPARERAAAALRNRRELRVRYLLGLPDDEIEFLGGTVRARSHWRLRRRRPKLPAGCLRRLVRRIGPRLRGRGPAVTPMSAPALASSPGEDLFVCLMLPDPTGQRDLRTWAESEARAIAQAGGVRDDEPTVDITALTLMLLAEQPHPEGFIWRYVLSSQSALSSTGGCRAPGEDLARRHSRTSEQVAALASVSPTRSNWTGVLAGDAACRLLDIPDRQVGTASSEVV